MKKWILILCVFLLFGCQEEPIVEPVEEVIVLDTDAYHNVKLKTYNNTLPHIIKSYDEMDDDEYGSFNIQMYDTNYDAVWKYSWRDLNKNQGDFAESPVIKDNKLVSNVQGVVSVHDLATGTYLWEIETLENSIVALNEGVLYVLHYNENFITGIDIESGKVILEIKDDGYVEADAVAIDDDLIVAYYRTTNMTRNAVAFDKDGTYKKKMQYEVMRPTKTVWDAVETSDESEDGLFLIDGSTKSMWQESVKGYGEKEWVEITKILPVMVSKLWIINGDQTSIKAFNDNAKLKTVSLSIGDGKSFTYTFEYFGYGYKDEIQFVKPIVADYIMMTIVESEPGDLFKNTCVTEIGTE